MAVEAGLAAQESTLSTRHYWRLIHRTVTQLWELVRSAYLHITRFYSVSGMLCSDCESLGLSPERFLYAPDNRSTTQESSVSTQIPCHRMTRDIRSIKQNPNCRLCQLLYNSVTATDSNSVNDETECRIEWVKDGQQIASTNGYDPISRRRHIRISWMLSKRLHGCKVRERENRYLLYIPSQNPNHPSTMKHSLLDEEIKFLAQDYSKDIYGWIESWIRLCERKHQNAYTQIEDKDTKAFCDLARKSWFCVIDVEKMCLTTLKFKDNGQPELYAALSYVWGQDIHRTLLSNIMNRKKDGGIVLDEMPRTIQDAISLVKTLSSGVRYIWIDSLCIPQDRYNNKSWKLNADKMDLIFGNAYFTICAADGDSSTGLVAMDPGKRNYPMKEKVKEGMEVFVSSSPESVIESSRWSERGWTFQERILSRRCLVFAEGRIYLQCRENNYDFSSTNWSSDWRKSPLCTVKGLEDRPMWFYMTCVELYTGRALTRSEDILEAFNGVSRIIEERMCAPFFFGLPSSHFDFALLWRPRSGKKRRGDKCPRPGDPEKDVEFPSWSWSGWQDNNPNKGSATYYPHDLLEGCRLDLHDWLLSHTWIVWYIRDIKGDLEPLWQGYTDRYTERSQKIAECWRGYGNKWDRRIQEYRNDVSAYDRRYPYFDLPSEPEFKRELPSNPFGCPISRERENEYQPILQFWTWKTEFYIVRNNDCPGPGRDLVRLDVLDKDGDWWGTVVVDESWAEKQNKNKLHDFIALSDARNLTKDECSSWTYPIPKNIEEIDWILYHVMLIEYCEKRCVWERKGLGKVLQAAFKPLERSKWAEIALG